MLTMFQVLTLEGWLDVRDMLVGEGTSPGIPRFKEAWVMDTAACTCVYLYIKALLSLLFSPAVYGDISAHLHLLGSQHWAAAVRGYCGEQL